MNQSVYLDKILKGHINYLAITKDDYVIVSINTENLLNTLTFFKYHTNTQAKLLLDIYAVDYPTRQKRFEVNYLMLSTFFNNRFFLKTNIMQDQIVNSVMSIFNSANWLEREIWDMFGIFFKNHKDLRRILTDYGFEGFPLRKDFPLTGYLQFRYDDETQTVISEPVELSQEFRGFEYIMPWSENK